MDLAVNSMCVSCLIGNLIRLNGKSLFVPIRTETQETKRVKNGSVITVKHSGMNVHGTLLYPQFYRERSDLQWSDLATI